MNLGTRVREIHFDQYAWEAGSFYSHIGLYLDLIFTNLSSQIVCFKFYKFLLKFEVITNVQFRLELASEVSHDNYSSYIQTIMYLFQSWSHLH